MRGEGTSFTIHDTPEIVGRVERDLSLITEAVVAADPALRSLVLTGGFARGEGAVRRGAPVNDYDLIAFRGLKPRSADYADLARVLSREVALHVDLAPVAAWRLGVAPRSIFWYETALRGRVLFGEDLLGRIRVREARDLDRGEGLRLLVNRAAGLLLVTESADADAVRLQAAKGLLAALDARLLSLGEFAPSQRERWARFEAMRAQGTTPADLEVRRDALAWAFRFKVAPDEAAPRSPSETWRVAAAAILDAVPFALAHAGLDSLDAYAHRDRWIDALYYARHSASLAGAPRFARHATGRVRVATLRLLARSLDGHVPAAEARRIFDEFGVRDEPLSALDALRRATLQ